jgi:hypothetical protein
LFAFNKLCLATDLVHRCKTGLLSVSDEIPSAARIFEIGTGFRASKALLSAIELDVFTILSVQPLGLSTLTERTGIAERGAKDFFDSLVAIGFLARDAQGRYANAADADLYLDRKKPTYIGALFEQYSTTGFGLWNSLTEALRTGSPPIGTSAASHFSTTYGDAEQFRRFVKSMTAGSLLTAKAIAAQFPWRDYKTLVDVGTAEGCLPVEVALAHPHIQGGGFDLPALRESFEAYVAERNLSARLQFFAGDFLKDPLPSADVLVFGRILHNWGDDARRVLLRKAYDSLNEGGAIIVYETLIPDDRRAHAAGLLASLNMLLWTPAGSDFSAADCAVWMQEAGFREVRAETLAGADAMVIAKKR